MRQNLSGRSFRGSRVLGMSRWLMVAVLLTFNSGCTSGMLVGLGYLIGGPPSIAPIFDQQQGFSLKDDDKKIAVVCYAPKELKFDVDDVDAEIAKQVAYRLNNKGMKVIAPAVVQHWLDHNDDWDSPAEIGVALEADWVIYIDMEEYSLYEKGSTKLYRGRTSAMVEVYDMSDGAGHEIFAHELTSTYPLRQAASTDDIPKQRFKSLYMSYLGEEIGKIFYPHYAGDSIPHGVLSN